MFSNLQICFCTLQLFMVLNIVVTLPRNFKTVTKAQSAAWSSTGSLRHARTQHSATVLSNGKVLVTGGVDSDQYPKGYELYHPATGKWIVNETLAARWLHTSSLLLDGKVLLTGGIVCESEDACAASTHVELYNPIENTWTKAASMHSERMQHTASVLSNGHILVAGGRDSSWGSLNTCELYDPSTDKWLTTSSMQDVHVFHTATVLSDGKVLITGGLYSIMSTGSCELYDLSTGNWTKMASMNVGRREHTATLLRDGQVLVTGGLDDSGVPMASCELYNPSTNTWKMVNPMSVPRTLHTASLLPNGQVLLAGGSCYSYDLLNSTELYDPLTGNWTNGDNMLTAIFEHTASVLKNGHVLISGGNPGTGEYDGTNVSMIYSPSMESSDGMKNRHSSHKILMLRNEKVSTSSEENIKTANHKQQH